MSHFYYNFLYSESSYPSIHIKIVGKNSRPSANSLFLLKLFEIFAYATSNINNKIIATMYDMKFSTGINSNKIAHHPGKLPILNITPKLSIGIRLHHPG